MGTRKSGSSCSLGCLVKTPSESVVQLPSPDDAEQPQPIDCDPHDAADQDSDDGCGRLDAVDEDGGPPEDQEPAIIRRNAQLNLNLELPMLVLAFCLTFAIEIALGALQKDEKYPWTFHSVCLMMVFPLTSIVVAKYVTPKYLKGARVLAHFGVLFGVLFLHGHRYAFFHLAQEDGESGCFLWEART